MSGGEQPNFFKKPRKSIGEAYDEISWRRAEGLPDPMEQFKVNQELEFDAPQYYEEGYNEEHPEDYIDPWFLKSHPELRPAKSEMKKNEQPKIRKKKFSAFQKENNEVTKRPEPPKLNKTFTSVGVKALGEKENISLNTVPNLNIMNNNNNSKKEYSPAVNVSLNASLIGKVKRGISKDTYNYYANHQNFLNNTALGRSVSPIRKPASAYYVPRMHTEKVMKKWSNLHGGINWYTLSPRSRENANKEMTEMVKAGQD